MKYIVLALIILASLGLGFYVWQGKVNSGQSSSMDKPALVDETSPALPGAVKTEARVNKNPEKKTSSSEDRGLDLDQRYAYVSNNEDYPTLRDRLTAMSERRNGRQYTDEEVVAAMEDEPWEEIDEVPEALVLDEEDKTDGREFIRFNPLKIESLMPGDTLKMPISQIGEDLNVRIDQVIANEGGSLTWEGTLLDDPDGNSVIITQSERLTVAGIGTGQGHFELQAHNNVGWIASSQTLFKQNFNETDAIVPPHEH